ncbi:hypothetical protein [Shewanella atlantica]|uniref:hypothetical protein n=1 Tax=Shewanella atlantica TaxID=271099 RepID=UPI0037368BE1
MKHSKKVLTASIALLLGVSGAAFGLLFSGNLLENPGFEVEGVDAADAADWTQVGAATRDNSNANSGSWSMFMNWDGDAVYGGSASQEVEGLDECSPYGLGMFEASGYYDNSGESGSVAGMTVQFNVGSPFAMASDGDNGDYEEMTILDNIPAWAESAMITVDGMHPVFETVPSVHWDDVEFSTDCVYDYAKVSGKAGVGLRGREGRNGKYSFSGAIGTLESEACGDANPVGMLHINYKNAGFTCDFTPTAPVVYDDGEGTATLAVSYECEGDDLPDDGVGDATIVLTQGDGGPNGNGNTKDRGMISVTNDDGDDEDGINIDEEGESIDLDKGNVNLMQPAACPE